MRSLVHLSFSTWRVGAWSLVLGLVQAAAADPASVPVRIVVQDQETARPVFARVVLRNEAGTLMESAGYQDLNGHFVTPDGWSIALEPGIYRYEVDAGFEYYKTQGEWRLTEGGEQRINLRRWVDLRRQGWICGGDHNHLIRDGAEDKNYEGTSVTMEFAAAAMASRGWSYFMAGGGGPWRFNGNGTCDARDDNNQTVQAGRQTEAAAQAWNQRYGNHCVLWWNNEQVKGRYGHLWFLGRTDAGIRHPYSDRPADTWWSHYDVNWDPWQTVDKSKPIGPYASEEGPLLPPFDCIQSWRTQGLVSVYAHPTRTFRIGSNRVSNIAASFPFDLLAGAPVGGLVVMGDSADHGRDQALWFAALNEGYQVPGLAENDTVFGRASIRSRFFTTYTFLPEAAAGPVDLAELASNLAAGRNFLSSGAFCLVRLGKDHGMGETVLDPPARLPLAIQAWASADAEDQIDTIEIIANGTTVQRVEAARGQRAFEGTVELETPGLKWVVVKVRCRDRSAVAITNPVYLRSSGEPLQPEPLRTTVSGRVTDGGEGVAAEIVVRVWGEECGRARADESGRYRMENVPLAAHLQFRHGGRQVTRTIFADDAEFREVHHRIYATDYVGTPDALGGCYPPDYFGMLREMAREAVVDAAF